jgi:dephospho-CoA kinase
VLGSWNDHDRAYLEKEVHTVMKDVRSRSPRWWSTLLWIAPPVGAMAGLWSWYKMKKVQEQWEEEKKRQKAKL